MPRGEKDTAPKRKSASRKQTKIAKALKPQAQTKSTNAAGKGHAEWPASEYIPTESGDDEVLARLKTEAPERSAQKKRSVRFMASTRCGRAQAARGRGFLRVEH
jgi:hypothetical protein